MRAALYVRVSTTDQAEKFSLPAQRRILSEHADRQGWKSELYEDAGISGETLDARPAMMRLLQDARAARIQIAMAIEMERFSRSKNLFDWLIIKQAFREGGVRFGTPAQLYDPAEAEDDFLTNLFGALSTREKQKMLARTVGGRLEAARSGRYVPSHAAYGYRLAGRGEGRLVVHDGEAEIVRLIYDLTLQGKSAVSVSLELARRQIPTPNGRQLGWRTSTLHQILTNTTYAGTAYYHRLEKTEAATGRKSTKRLRPVDQWIPVTVPAIVAKETFAQVQAQRKRNRRLSPRNQKRSYLLKGLVHCGSCGHSMSGTSGTTAPYHRCNGKHPDAVPRCTAPAIRAELLETFVWDQLTQMLRDPERIIVEARRWRESHLKDRDVLEARLTAAQSQLAKLPDERGRVIRAYREKWISDEECKAQLRELEIKRTALETDVQALAPRLSAEVASEDQTVQLGEVLERFGRRLQDLSFDERFQIVHALVQRVVVHNGGGVEIHAFVPADQAPADSGDCAQSIRTTWPQSNGDCAQFVKMTWAQSIPAARRGLSKKRARALIASALRESEHEAASA